MNYRSVIIFLIALITCEFCLAQTNRIAAVEDFKPASSNQPGKQYPQVNSEGRVRARISAPQAQKVQPEPRDGFTKDMINDIIPFVEANYPVLNDSKNHTVAGFSVGGGQTLNLGLTNPDKFAYLCSYTPYTATDEFKKNFTKWSPDATLMNSQLKLFSISIAIDDFLYERIKQNIKMFREKNLNLQTLIVPGGHTWMNCKLYLTNTL